MRSVGRERRIRLRKRGLDEQNIGVVDEANDRMTVGGRIGDVGHVTDLLSGRDRRRRAQRAERRGPRIRRFRARGDFDRIIVGSPLEKRAFERAQPGADRKPQFGEPVLPDIDMRRLLHREGEAGRAVLEHRGRNAERRLGMDEAVDQRAGAERLDLKPGLEPHLRRADRQVGVDLGDDEDQFGGEALDEVPAIGGKLVMDLRDEPGGPVQPDDLVPPDPSLNSRSKPMKWSMWACETKTCSRRWILRGDKFDMSPRSNMIAPFSNSVST